jgi:hypothetical protein
MKNNIVMRNYISECVLQEPIIFNLKKLISWNLYWQ